VTPRDLIVDVLLTLGVGAEFLCCVGVLTMRNVFDRLHFSSAATTVGAFLIGAAVMVRESVSAGGLQTIATISVLFVLNPVVLIATARAARRIDEKGRK
jgi:multicomponent Na+:H+ antiporter subunit G